MSNRKFLRVAAGIAAVVLAAGVAAAFGIETPEKGVGREHERITRAAISDLEPATLDAMAGRGEEPGAVGALDSMAGGAKTHCDNGDYLSDGSYPQPREAAEAALTACRTFMLAELEGAVTVAKDLLAPTAETTALNCDFRFEKGSAKCAVLMHVGRALHTAQDFYAHTNWVDQPAEGPVTANNPPGLGKTGRAPWIDPRKQEPFPEGLISGCTGEGTLLSACDYGSWVPELGFERVSRRSLGKDFGPIGRGGSAGGGMTFRGAISGNFRNAVAAAIDDTRDKWAYFKDRVRAVYGADGEAILCALTHDAFDAAACAKAASDASSCAVRAKFYVDNGGNGVPPELTDAERTDITPHVERLAKFCQLEEAELTRDAVLSNGAAADGRAFAKTRAIDMLATWNACPVQARSWLDVVEPAHKEALRTRQPGDKASVRRDLLGAAYADCILKARLHELGK